MRAKRKDIQGKKKVPVLSSIRFRVMFTVGIAVFIAVLSILLVVTIPVRKELNSVNSEYLYMTTVMYGKKLETAVNLTQNHTDIRKVPFRLEAFLQGGRLERCESSYCYLVRDDGIMLYHPNHDKIGRQVENEQIKSVVAQLQSGNVCEPDIVTYDFNGVKKMASYYASSKGFVFVISVDQKDFTSTLTKMTRVAILAGILIFIVMLGFGLYVALRITRPIETVAEVVDRIGELDFTDDSRTPELARRKDETGVIAHSVENMRIRLVEIIERIQTQSTLLYNTSNELFKSAQDTSEDASHIENAVGDIATGATSQADETMRASDDVGVIGNMIVDTERQVARLSETANNMKETSEDAFATLAELANINEQTAESIERIYEQTNQTNEAAKKIKEAAGLIASIASETNLLSLNASIEAARAGDAGKGFAVVATEIQKLAVESAGSAKSIDEIIKELVDDSTKAVEIMDEVKGVMQRQNTMVEQTQAAFKEVREGIDSSLDNADNIREHANKLDNARVNIVSTVENLSAIAEENAASSQETSSTMSHILSALQVVAKDSDKLNEIAKVLDDSINEIHI